MSGKKDTDAAKCYAKNRTPESCPPIQNVTHPLRYYEFTQDEIKTLEECDKESFYQRCIPFGTLFASLTYAAIKLDLLKRNPHFGVYPKLLFAALVGHVYGRISYMEECDKKLRRLPDSSYLGRVMKKHYTDNNPPPPKK